MKLQKLLIPPVKYLMAEVKGSEYMFDQDGKLLYNLQGDSDSGEKED